MQCNFTVAVTLCMYNYSQLACDDVPCLLLATLILGLKELERSHAHVVPR